MATCKECLHVEVCKFKDLPAPLSDSYIRESECIEKRCSDFKDRSRFVELPCKIGGTIYHIENGKIVEYIVFATHTYSRKSRNKHKLFLTLPSDGRIHLVINDFDMANGITVFLNKEEAEQALKECNSDD